MDLKKYEIFLKAVDCGSFSKTAAETGYTPSGIVHMMNALEAEIGFPLLVRTKAGVSLTKNGEETVPLIRFLLNAEKSLNQRISEIKELDRGEITVGTFASISISWLPEIISAFSSDFPHIKINLIEGATQELEELLSGNRIDFAMFSFQPHMDLQWVPLKEDPVLAVLPPDHPSAAEKSYPVEKFRGESLIIPSRGIDYDAMRILDEAGIPGDYSYSTMDDYAAVAMVEQGLCVSLIPELVLAGRKSRVVALELDPPQYRTLGVAARSFRDLSPAAARFFSYIRKNLEDYVNKP